jgi:hypothetical protein
MTMRPVLFALLLIAPAAAFAGPYADGWTDEGVAQAVEVCTNELVQGAWNNTKKDQGIDADRPLTPEIRKQLAPQIEALRGLCDCTVKNAAKKFGAAAYHKDTDAVGRYAQDLVKKGTCKKPQL